MIQRVQTLYLLIATILMSLTLISPVATFVGGGEELVIKAFSFSTSSSALPYLPLYMGILLAFTAALPFVTIFLYKKRMLQIRFCGVEIVLLVGSLIFEAIYCYLAYQALNSLADFKMSLGVVAFLPIIAIVFVVLAMKAVFRDELLVRSLDRIR